MYFQLWLKTYTKHCTNNSLLSQNKTSSSLLELIDHMLSISEYYMEKLFTIWKNYFLSTGWKTYTKLCTINNVISCVKRLSLPALCSWPISGYDLENGRCLVGKNIELKNVAKISNLILFCFCLLCYFSPVSIVPASCFNYIGPCRWF